MTSNENFLDFQVKFLEMTMCPIALTTLEDPVMLIPSGQIYERKSIEEWLKKKNTDPITNIKLPVYKLYPVKMLKDVIDLLKDSLPEFLRDCLVKNQDLSDKIAALELKNIGKEAKYDELCDQFLKMFEDKNLNR